MTTTHARFNTLMTKLADGDASVLDELIDGLYPIVRRFCATLLQDADAQDATQRTFQKLMGRHHQFDAKRGNALSWVLAFASWECKSILRSSHRAAVRTSGDTESIESQATGLTHLIEKERLEDVYAAIDSLDDKDRTALLRTFLDGALSPNERKQKQRALVRLRNALGFS